MQIVVDRIERIRAVQHDDAQTAVGLHIDFVWHSVHFS